MRKKIFNQMEDMKGKIRVYCRVRPILQMEKDRGQVGELSGVHWLVRWAVGRPVGWLLERAGGLVSSPVRLQGVAMGQAMQWRVVA